MALKGLKSFFNRDECEKYYKLGKTLGQGSFATVKIGVAKEDGSKWAIKIIKKSSLGPEDEEALRTEVEILSALNHAHIVKLKQVFDCAQNFYMVMEVCSGGELFDRIVEKEHYTEEEARKCIVEVTNALAYIHGQNIAHRDLKPENLLYNNPTDTAVIKIADFGLAKLLDANTLMHTACGTPGYVAPEILEGRGYGIEVDMWSLGVIAYILLCGFPPFYDENQRQLFRQIRAGRYDYPSPHWDHVSDLAKDLVSSMLVLDPKRRAKTEDVLNHPWVCETQPSHQRHLPMFRDAMRQYNIRRKFKASVVAIGVISRFKSQISKSDSRVNSFAEDSDATQSVIQTLDRKISSDSADFESPRAINKG